MLSLAFLPLLLSLTPVSRAAKAEIGGYCDPTAIHLDVSTLALDSGCVATAYCNTSSSVCVAKGCRRDEYPYGYTDDSTFPPRCGAGYVCPDEMDACTPQVDVGQPCQLDRDDECSPPSNYLELKSSLNVNGSICLNQMCHYSNVTEGQACEVENVAFVGYESDGSEFADVRSRDNCIFGFYCDGSTRICTKTLALGASCSADKTCASYNCDINGKCIPPSDSLDSPKAWVYVVVALCIVIIIVGTLGTLWIFHRRSREEYQVRLEQYYTEQVAYRESLFSLSQTRDSLLNLPKNTPVDVARQSLLVPSESAEGWSPRDQQFSR